MIAKGIVVFWQWSHEYIEIDLDDVENAIPITSTMEWWHDDNRVVRYNVNCEINKLAQDIIELVIQYQPEMNPHIPLDESCWGESRVRIIPGTDTGMATWTDAHDQSHDGSVKWSKIKTGLFKEKGRQATSRIVRDRRFRNALLAHDPSPKCEITAESTTEALEAAHIISSAAGGAEVLQNGILLRADLHRLYDCRLFDIDPNGEIVHVKSSLSPTYQDILRHKRIRPDTLARVRDALLQKCSSN